MYSKNKLSRKAVKYRTWKFFKKIRKYIFGLAERRVGVTKKGAFTRKRKLSYLSVFLTILDVGRKTLQMKLCRLLNQDETIGVQPAGVLQGEGEHGPYGIQGAFRLPCRERKQ